MALSEEDRQEVAAMIEEALRAVAAATTTAMLWPKFQSEMTDGVAHFGFLAEDHQPDPT